MNRRRLLGALAASALPIRARAQDRPAGRPLIGFLNSASPGPFGHLARAFDRGLRDAGYLDGQNIAVAYRWAEGQYDRLPAMVDELIRQGASLIAATGGEHPAMAAKAATGTIPIVFAIGDDPVAIGLVANLYRPGANLTGLTMFTTPLEAKRLELLNDLVPGAGTVGALINPRNRAAEAQQEVLRQTAASLGKTLVLATAAEASAFESTIADLVRRGVRALVVASDPYFNTHRDRLVHTINRIAVPTVYEFREFAQSGGLVSYGTDLSDGYRQVGGYAGRILKGARPETLPVLQPTRFELVVNTTTARELGLALPETVLARADEVIE